MNESRDMAIEFVAEVGSNHNQDLDRCLALVDNAADVGATAVKFQLFKIDDLFAPEILSQSPDHRARKKSELPVEFLPQIAARARERGLAFSCTPFYLTAVDELAPFVDFYKIASYELLWNDLLNACAQTGKRVVLSTGMATTDEIDSALEVLSQGGCSDIVLLHCVSAYPAAPEECNLAAIQTLRDRYQLPVGWSDHSVNPAVLYRAIFRWAASLVEFHFDLDGQGGEFEAGHCWLPDPIAALIGHCRTGVRSDGSGKKEPQASEREDRAWRADPADGLRPLLNVRKEWIEARRRQQ